jgi:general secretion pathway protein G
MRNCKCSGNKPLPFRGGVGVGTVNSSDVRNSFTVPTPNPSSEGEGDNGFTPLRRSAENGFTLVELMVVLVILGLLATVVIINVLPQQDKALVTKAKADVALLDQGLELYKLNNLTYPNSGEGLQALVSKGVIKKLPKDPWGRAYIYSAPGQHGPVDVSSLGADGTQGGEGDNADIGNWQ